MPKSSSKRQGAKVATVRTDDDFDQILSEVMAADALHSADRSQIGTTISSVSVSASGDGSGSSSSSSSSNSSSSSSDSQTSSTQEGTVSEEAISDACRKGNIAQLRLWGRQGVRVQSAVPLICAVFDGAQTNVLRCLVNDLGADINLTSVDGVTAVFVAARLGILSMVRCLVKEFDADANQANDETGFTPLFMAAHKGDLDMVRCLVKVSIIRQQSSK
jgi:hypothetical protein